MVSEKDLIKTAKQARLELDSQEAKELISQVKEIVDYFAILSTADTKNVSETIHPLHVENRFRDDKVGKSLTQEEALKNTRNKKDGYFIGPVTKG